MASSQLMRFHLPSPRAPARRMGWSSRSGWRSTCDCCTPLLQPRGLASGMSAATAGYLADWFSRVTLPSRSVQTSQAQFPWQLTQW